MTDQPLIDQPIIGDATVQEAIEGADSPPFRTILEVWREVLTSSEKVKAEKITPQWSTRITSTYREVNYADMPTFRDRYFAHVKELLDQVIAIIESDEECLSLTTPEEDVEHNAGHYAELLTSWQITVLGWELDWDCTDPHAGAELAAIAETHTMFFGSMGLTALLDQIPFEFTDMHRDALSLALQSYKDGREGSSE